jgi:hypothetical protein
MHDVLAGKPEITPPVIVNSRTGTFTATKSSEDDVDLPRVATQKRKAKDTTESPASKRHRESMEFRQTAHSQFMELMAKLIDKL